MLVFQLINRIQAEEWLLYVIAGYCQSKGYSLLTADMIQNRFFPCMIFLYYTEEREGILGAKDVTEKNLEDYNDVFADIFNVLVFKGERCILPGALTNVSVHSQYKADDGVLHEEERDVVKYWTGRNVRVAICGIENQTKPEKRMPLRIMGYEGASYRSQLKKKHVAPVVTIVLYFGEKHWNYKKSLKEFLNIPEGLEEYVNDCRIHVYEVSWLTEEQLSMFTSDFGIVERYFVEKRKNPDYIPDDRRTIRHVDEVLKLLSVMTGDDRYVKIKRTNGRRPRNMCDVAERLERRGIKRGKIIGAIEVLRDLMYSDEDILKSLMKKFALTEEEARMNIARYGKTKGK